MKNDWPAKLHCIRGVMGCCHLLENGNASVFIDAGLWGEPFFIRRLLRRLHLAPQSIQAILLTHGHLDHTGNLAWLKNYSGAKVYAHPAEARHVSGTYPYQGIARWCGRLEKLGRVALRYRPVSIDVPLQDGDELPFWGGLKVIHLPGHTEGHCGFFSRRHELLFSGDLMASYWFHTHRPPAILNSASEMFPASIQKVRTLAPRRIVPSHYDFQDALLHRRRFAKLFGIDDWKHSATTS